jgi:hypothetical protein
MPAYADRVKETSTSTGASTFTLDGAVSQFQSFNTAFGTYKMFGYAIVGQSGTEWEIGKGYLTNSTTLVREGIRSSSNSNNIVTFSAGTKDVFCTPAAENIDNANIGVILAQVSGWAMP